MDITAHASRIIPNILDSGYKIVTADELLGLAGVSQPAFIREEAAFQCIFQLCSAERAGNPVTTLFIQNHESSSLELTWVGIKALAALQVMGIMLEAIIELGSFKPFLDGDGAEMLQIQIFELDNRFLNPDSFNLH